MSGKQELNAVLAKENTRRTIRVKTRVFYAMKTERVSLQNKYVGVQPYATAKKKLNTTIKTLQEQHIAYEAIKL